MTASEPASPPQIHEDPSLFREAVGFTAAEQRFLPRLVEKDYFCTLLLARLSAADRGLVFKGGTCLAKVHARFYRLSEDLDFTIPVSASASRAERRTRSERLKAAVARLPGASGPFRIIEPLSGANNSTQYSAVVGYPSLLGAVEETIKIEVGLREPLLIPAVNGIARTLLLNPFSGEVMVPPLSVRCISWEEAMAEKLRAALTRREAAVRDFYDIDDAVREQGFRPLEEGMSALLRKKLAAPGNEPVDVSPERFAAIRRQMEPRLAPVLRPIDFSAFDLDRAFGILVEVAAAVGPPRP
jgi:predicted nucleotidyltransferase component of viral defense system